MITLRALYILLLAAPIVALDSFLPGALWLAFGYLAVVLLLELLCAIKSQILDEQAVPIPEPKFPEVHVQLSGEDGNVFAVIGRVRQALRKGGATVDDVKAFTDEVGASRSYDEALLVVMRWVDAS